MAALALSWKWDALAGSHAQLRLNRRDLPTLDWVIGQCRQHRVAVQAGGNLGIWPKRLAQSFETVYTFEPAPDLFPVLVANAPERNILRYQAALGAKAELVGTCSQRRDGKSAGNHEGLTHIAGTGNVPTLRLDDFQLPVCDLLYLDIEGWELYALQGAAWTLRRCRPVVAVEINKQLAFVHIQPEQVRGFLRDRGYVHVHTLVSDEVFLPEEWTDARGV